MTDIEQKALALVNEIEREEGENELTRRIMRGLIMDEALCRAIEQHEAFRQEVSGVMTYIKALYPTLPRNFNRFIIPKPKPDPLVAALEGVTFDHYPLNDAKTIRAALDKLGFEIREKNDD